MAIFLETKITGESGTKEFGRAFAECIKPQDLILLSGDLGAGKTTFVAGVVSKLCYLEEATSPTFTLIHRYRGRAFDVLHADLWRLETEKEILDLSIWEELEEGMAAFVEWGEKAGDLLGVPEYLISFREQQPGSRVARIFFPNQGTNRENLSFFYNSAMTDAGVSDVLAQESPDIVKFTKSILYDNGISVRERQIEAI